jgi:hypothetical protein
MATHIGIAKRLIVDVVFVSIPQESPIARESNVTTGRDLYLDHGQWRDRIQRSDATRSSTGHVPH